MRSRARRAHLDRRRLPPVPESSPAGGPAALAHAVRAAAAGDPPPPGEHFRLPVRGLRVRELPAPCADQGAGGGVNAAVTAAQAPLIEVRASPLHGLGVFAARRIPRGTRSEEHTSELQSRRDLVCRLLLEKKKKENKV